MKKLSIALIAGLLIVASCKSKKEAVTEAATETAVEATEEVRKESPKRGGGSLEERLAKQEEMYTSLGISEDQKVQFRAIETKYAEKLRAARESAGGNKEAMRTAMRTVQDDKMGEISNILSPDQFTKYKTLLSEMRQDRRGGRGR